MVFPEIPQVREEVKTRSYGFFLEIWVLKYDFDDLLYNRDNMKINFNGIIITFLTLYSLLYPTNNVGK